MLSIAGRKANQKYGILSRASDILELKTKDKLNAVEEEERLSAFVNYETDSNADSTEEVFQHKNEVKFNDFDEKEKILKKVHIKNIFDHEKTRKEYFANNEATKSIQKRKRNVANNAKNIEVLYNKRVLF